MTEHLDHPAEQRLGTRRQSDESEGPLRMCMGCRERRDPRTLVRLVRDAQQQLQIDMRQKLDGRGAYLHLNPGCLEQAKRKRMCQQVLGPGDDLDDLDELLARMTRAAQQRFCERVSLARRAGAVIGGIEEVRQAMQEDRALFICLAADASESTRQQLKENARRKGLLITECLTGQMLARAVGMDYLSVLAVIREPFASDLECLCAPLEESARTSPRRP